MVTKRQKPTTLDDLASIINQLTETQKYKNQRRGKVEGVLKDMAGELNATHEDVRYLRTQHGFAGAQRCGPGRRNQNPHRPRQRLKKKIGIIN